MLSQEGKRHQRRQAEYNRRASEFIFRENNAPGRVADDTIDLHGQYVNEAREILEARIRHAQATGQTHLHVIVGKGNHSAGRVQKLKPRVERLCRELGLDYATEENEGRIYVDLRGRGGRGRRHHAAASRPPPLPDQPHGYQGDQSASRPHRRPQRQRPQRRQQQQQQQEEEEGEGEGGIFDCLKACCLVM